MRNSEVVRFAKTILADLVPASFQAQQDPQAFMQENFAQSRLVLGTVESWWAQVRYKMSSQDLLRIKQELSPAWKNQLLLMAIVEGLRNSSWLQRIPSGDHPNTGRQSGTVSNILIAAIELIRLHPDRELFNLLEPQEVVPRVKPINASKSGPCKHTELHKIIVTKTALFLNQKEKIHFRPLYVAMVTVGFSVMTLMGAFVCFHISPLIISFSLPLLLIVPFICIRDLCHLVNLRRKDPIVSGVPQKLRSGVENLLRTYLSIDSFIQLTTKRIRNMKKTARLSENRHSKVLDKLEQAIANLTQESANLLDLQSECRNLIGDILKGHRIEIINCHDLNSRLQEVLRKGTLRFEETLREYLKWIKKGKLEIVSDSETQYVTGTHLTCAIDLLLKLGCLRWEGNRLRIL